MLALNAFIKKAASATTITINNGDADRWSAPWSLNMEPSMQFSPLLPFLEMGKFGAMVNYRLACIVRTSFLIFSLQLTSHYIKILILSLSRICYENKIDQRNKRHGPGYKTRGPWKNTQETSRHDSPFYNHADQLNIFMGN